MKFKNKKKTKCFYFKIKRLKLHIFINRRIKITFKPKLLVKIYWKIRRDHFSFFKNLNPHVSYSNQFSYKFKCHHIG